MVTLEANSSVYRRGAAFADRSEGCTVIEPSYGMSGIVIVLFTSIPPAASFAQALVSL